MEELSKDASLIAPSPARWHRRMTEEEGFQELALLPKRSREELQQLWAQHIGKPPAPGLRRELLVRILEYKIREQVYGGLRPHIRARLREIAESLEKEKPIKVQSERFNPGTRLLREWRGETHEVIQIEGAYSYRGKSYGSLSAIAKKITGTHWSGPLFFGTKAKKAPK